MLVYIRFVLGAVVAAVGVYKMYEYAQLAPSLERDAKLVLLAGITILGGYIGLHAAQRIYRGR